MVLNLDYIPDLPRPDTLITLELKYPLEKGQGGSSGAPFHSFTSKPSLSESSISPEQSEGQTVPLLN